MSNQFGQPAAIGADVTIKKRGLRDFSEEGFGDSLNIAVDARNEDGNFSVTVRKPWHQEVHLSRVYVPGDACGVERPRYVDITLRRLPNAPAVRQVVAPPWAYGPSCGGSFVLHAFVEADDSVSKAVTWVSGDTLVARVTADGRVTATCGRPPPDYTYVFAHAAADHSVKDSVDVGTTR